MIFSKLLLILLISARIVVLCFSHSISPITVLATWRNFVNLSRNLSVRIEYIHTRFITDYDTPRYSRDESGGSTGAREVSRYVFCS